MSTTIQISNRKTVVAAVPSAQLAKREAIFCVYRDLGPSRSYKRLIAAVQDKHGSVSARTLNSWSKMHSWSERLREHDDAIARAAVATENPGFDPNYDVEEALLHNCQIALQRALATNIVPQNAHQLKALVDLAINGLKAIELRRQGRRDKGEMAAGTKRVSQLLDAIEARIRAAYELKGVIDVEAVRVEQPQLEEQHPLTATTALSEAVHEPAADKAHGFSSHDGSYETAP
jgi:hypothetical protein